MTNRRKKDGGRPAGPGGQMLRGEKAKDFKGTMKDLLSYLRPHRWKLVLVFVFAMISTVFAIVSPTILGDATDVIVKGLFFGGGIDYDKLRSILIFLMALYGISFGFSFAQGFIMSKVAQQVTYHLRKSLSEKMERLPVGFFDTKSHGDIQSHFVNDIETINQTLSQSITQVITGGATILGIIVMMIRISFLMTIVALLVLPLSMVMIRLIVGKSQKHFDRQQEYLGKINGHVEEMYTGQTIIKAFNREEDSIGAFDEINESLNDSAWRSQFFSGLMMPITMFIGNLGYVAVCILGGYLAINGSISIGNIQAFIQYVRSLSHPVAQVANAANLLQSTAAAAERIFVFLREEEEADPYAPGETQDAVVSTQANCEGEVIFDHVTFGYKEGTPVIRDFNYVAQPGDRVAIVGPTGAGKTTLVKLLLRYYELQGGRILVDCRDIKEYSRRDLRNMFGMVLQDTWLFTGTVRDNIRYGKPDATDEEVKIAACAAHVDHFIRTQPGGYDMEINEDASNVSQGQKQLLTIARAILADSPILILDEATSSVDTRTEQQIQKAMANLMKGRTSFIIAHRLSTIKDADMILVMDQGDIVEQGTHEDLLAKGGYYAKLYSSQFS
ncbi:MAG: ABC transporter ATP-binding protein [Anaerovoracaceae bacterium]|jgi:ATP-binding cassette subfamily B multidrug efflux pump